jgi:hypothetical protein
MRDGGGRCGGESGFRPHHGEQRPTAIAARVNFTISSSLYSDGPERASGLIVACVSSVYWFRRDNSQGSGITYPAMPSSTQPAFWTR